jgi:hypothetical protein
MYILLLLLSSININYFEKYVHPKAEDLYLQLSKNLREEVQDNYYILQATKYEHNYIKEHLLNVSRYIKNVLLQKKMKNKRIIDYMFSRHVNMIKLIHNKAEYNLLQLENIRKLVSNDLADLKENHINMINKLNKNQIEINKILNNKKEDYMDLMTTYYKNWKDKREEIKDKINFDNDL